MLCTCVTKKHISPVGKQPLKYLSYKLSSAAYLCRLLSVRFKAPQKATGVSEGICHLARHLSGSKTSRGTSKFAQRILEVSIQLDLDSAPYVSSDTQHGATLPSQSVGYEHCPDPFPKWSLYLTRKESVRGESTSIPELLGNKQGDPDLNS